tara:strand:- start:617 stop:847 length:231 start_codon:yes stop_codon:yes gene_type:complete
MVAGMKYYHHVTLDESTAKHGSCEDVRFCFLEDVAPKIRSIDIPRIIKRLEYYYESYQILEQEHWDKMKHNHGDDE